MSTLADARRKPSTRRFYGELFDAAADYIREHPGHTRTDCVDALFTSQRTLHRTLELHGHNWRTLVHRVRSER